MREETIELSVIVPLYDEEDNVRQLHASISEVLSRLGKPYEVIFIDDGSTDRTFEILCELKQKDPHMKIVKFRINFGQTAAMLAGFDYARGRLIVSMDGDLQNDPNDIPTLLQKLDEGYDLVCGWRKNRKDKLITRKIPSRVANWLIGMLTGVKIHDNGCSLKAYRASIVKNINLYADLHRFVSPMATLLGARITEVVVHHHERKFGKSKYGISRAFKVLFDMIMVKMITGFISRPALWFAMLGVPFFLLGLLCLGITMYHYLYYGYVFFFVFPSIAFVLLAFFSYLILLGLIAEIVLKTGTFSQKRLVSHTALDV
jgi:glycosyltransferase involved in cell wall biosynthesis